MKSLSTFRIFALCLAVLTSGCSSNAENVGSTPVSAETSTQSQEELKIGDAAPVFSLRDQDNNEHKLEDYKGKVVVLAFYPADMTKGCTLQAQRLSTIAEDLEKRGVKLFGVSVQGIDSKKQFCDKEGIKYTLLADTDKAASRAYGVLLPSGVSSRTTFVITREGKIGAIQKKVSPATADKDTLRLVDEVLNQSDANAASTPSKT